MIFVSVYLANGLARQLYKREKDLVESIKKINAAEKEKQTYIMGIVHEIKTPIVAVASYIDIILQKFLGPIDETVEEKLVRAKNRTDEGIQMINDVLNVSKLTLYDQYDEEEFDIYEIVSGVIKRRTASADAHLIKLNLFDKRERKEKKRLLLSFDAASTKQRSKIFLSLFDTETNKERDNCCRNESREEKKERATEPKHAGKKNTGF